MTIVSLLFVLAFGLPSNCSCAKALDSDRPNGANELIEIRGPVAKNLVGTVMYPNGELAKEIVVELYDLSQDRSDIPTNEIVGSRSRKSACVTGTDGAFCFPNMPSGKYLLRLGTRQPNGINELYVRVTVDRSWFRGLFRRRHPLRLTLSLGT